LNPPPTRDIPILIGGSGEQKTLRYVAEYGTIWHAFGDAERLRHKAGVLDTWCEKAGRDPAEIERSTAVASPPEAVADGLLDVGVSLFTVSMSGPHYDLGLLREWIAWRDRQNV
jgi:alkanesulfonate monooxygenase SsuD/methylene tetrahydromethanopterin reductase-like flavin-dependent oxidoreductase (luciferase family)